MGFKETSNMFIEKIKDLEMKLANQAIQNTSGANNLKNKHSININKLTQNHDHDVLQLDFNAENVEITNP